jgi:hypothetical protein
MKLSPVAAALQFGAVLFAAATGAGCLVGEGSVAYKGTVTAADVAGHSFDAQPNPAGRSPILGAKVELAVATGKKECSEMRAPTPGATTDATGTFGTRRQYAGFIFSNYWVSICFRRPGFEPYVYHALVCKECPEPMGAEKFMNVYLRPTPPAEPQEESTPDARQRRW